MICRLINGLPLVDVRIGASDAFREYCERNLEVVPPDIVVKALVDTGASISVIDSSVIARLKLKDRGVCRVRGFDSSLQAEPSANEYLNYDIALAIVDDDGLPILRVGDLQAVGVPMGYEDYHALLGLDVLCHCNLILRVSAGEMIVEPAEG